MFIKQVGLALKVFNLFMTSMSSTLNIDNGRERGDLTLDISSWVEPFHKPYIGPTSYLVIQIVFKTP